MFLYSLRPRSSKENGGKKDTKSGFIGWLRNPYEQNEGRHTWDSQFQSFIYALGYCTGFGNVWRFPYFCYKHGSGFIIPYVILLFLIGLPMMCLELMLGQYTSRGPAFVFSQLSPICTGIGWAAVLVSVLCCLYYNLIIGWIIHYIWAVLYSGDFMPWDECDSKQCFTLAKSRESLKLGLAYWNHEFVPRRFLCASQNLMMHNLTHCIDPIDPNITVDFEQNGKLASEIFFYKEILRPITPATDQVEFYWDSVIFYTVSWIFVFVCLGRGIRGSGRITYFTVSFPCIVIIISLIKNILEFGILRTYIKLLDFSDLNLWCTTMWKDAGTQVLFSLGVSFGCLPTIASYNSLQQNIFRDSVLLVICNMATSIACTLLLYSTISTISCQLGKDIHEVIDIDHGIPFMIYSSVVTGHHVYAIIFYIMLLTMGIDTQLVMVETLISTIQDYWNAVAHHRIKVVIGTCVFLWLSGLFMCTVNGIVMFDTLINLTGYVSLFVIALFEAVAVMWIYGFDKIKNEIFKSMRIQIPNYISVYLYVTWKFITPLCLLIMIIITIFDEDDCPIKSIPKKKQTNILSLIMIPAVIISGAFFALYKKGFSKVGLFSSTEIFCPAHEEIRIRRNSLENTSNRSIQIPMPRTSPKTSPKCLRNRREQVSYFNEGLELSEITQESCNNQPGPNIQPTQGFNNISPCVPTAENLYLKF